jgi:hypothetical protein
MIKCSAKSVPTWHTLLGMRRIQYNFFERQLWPVLVTCTLLARYLPLLAVARRCSCSYPQGSVACEYSMQEGARTAVHPRVLRLPVNEPGNVGPTKTIFFRYSAGQIRDVITPSHVAFLLATFFASASAPATFPETGTPQYWIERILPRTRANRPIMFCIAASWGAIFAGIYEALQGEILARIDSCTRIVLSTGLCLCIRCIGGMFCHRCGKPGHLVSSCTQDIFTPWKEITFRCVCCRELGGVALEPVEF